MSRQPRLWPMRIIGRACTPALSDTNSKRRLRDLTSVCMICSRSRTAKFPACPSNELYDEVPCNDDGYP